jgi:F420-non-reducing hydrogenase iron-sulfur subunit
MAGEFEPKIIAFCCNWCSYAGADLAGVSRLQYPPNIRVIRVMCSGRISPDFVLKAFQMGADGVLVSGWHIGDCHYQDGNEKAKRIIDMTRELLDLMGIDKERLALEWVSSAEGGRFAEVVTSFTQKIKDLGKNPLGVAAWTLKTLPKPLKLTIVWTAGCAREAVLYREFFPASLRESWWKRPFSDWATSC